MAKRSHPSHSPAFNAKVALPALKATRCEDRPAGAGGRFLKLALGKMALFSAKR